MTLNLLIKLILLLNKGIKNIASFLLTQRVLRKKSLRKCVKIKINRYPVFVVKEIYAKNLFIQNFLIRIIRSSLLIMQDKTISDKSITFPLTFLTNKFSSKYINLYIYIFILNYQGKMLKQEVCNETDVLEGQ